MTNYIAAAVILGIVGIAAWYLHSRKKHGQACVGCPCAKQCGGKNCSGNHTV